MNNKHNSLLCSEAALVRCSYEKLFWKYVANLQKNIQAKVWFLWSCFLSTWKSHFGIRCSPVNLLLISEHHLWSTASVCMFSVCICFLFVCFLFDIFAFVILHSFYVSREFSLIHKSSHWEIFYNEVVLHLYSKITWRSSSFSSVVCSKLTNLLNWTSF